MSLWPASWSFFMVFEKQYSIIFKVFELHGSKPASLILNSSTLSERTVFKYLAQIANLPVSRQVFHYNLIPCSCA